MEVLTLRTSGTRAKEASGSGCQVPMYNGQALTVPAPTPCKVCPPPCWSDGATKWWE